MRVELHDKFQDPMSVPATRVVIYDDYDNPIAVVVQINPGHYLASHAGDKQFKEVLATLGINKTLIIDTINTEDLRPIS
jgi:hypothetical protein